MPGSLGSCVSVQHTRQHCPWWERVWASYPTVKQMCRPLERSVSFLPLPPFLENKGITGHQGVGGSPTNKTVIILQCSAARSLVWEARGGAFWYHRPALHGEAGHRSTQCPFGRNSLALCIEYFILQQLTKEDPFTFRERLKKGWGGNPEARAGIREMCSLYGHMQTVIQKSSLTTPNSFCQL